MTSFFESIKFKQPAILNILKVFAYNAVCENVMICDIGVPKLKKCDPESYLPYSDQESTYRFERIGNFLVYLANYI